MGEIRKRGNVWWIRYYRDGRRHEESSGSARKKDAQDLLRIREGDVAKGVPVSAKVGQLRFDEAADDVLTDYQVNGRKTYKDVEARIRLHLRPFFGGRRMTSITTADVRRYIAQRQEPTTKDDGEEKPGAANATINRELAVLKRAFRLAEQANKLMHRPHIPMLEERNVRTGFFERDEFEDVRKHLPKELRGLVTFAYYTGWRIPSEVLPLQWGQVDREAQVVRLEAGTTKNSEARTLPYGSLPELVEVMEDAWAEHKRLAAKGTLCPFVFHRDGERIRHLYKAWNNACEDAGVPGKLMHDFRRTAVRNLVRAGVPDTVAMAITGHKTRSVFDRYDITSEDDIRDGLGRLAGGSPEKVMGTEKGQSGRSGRVTEISDSL